jgi:hypothetical protein
MTTFPSELDAPPPDAPDDESPATVFRPTPFRWRDPKAFPRRQFVYGRHYARRFVSVTAATTKTGKTSLSLVEAVAMSSGRNLLGVKPSRPMKVWYWNGEDPREEIERRVLAICLQYVVDRKDIERNLFIDSGRETEIIVATQAQKGIVVSTPVEAALTAALVDGKFDVLIIDPAVSVHRVSENDNTAIDAVAKVFARIAEAANVAIEIVSHTRKLGDKAATIEDARGASAWTAAARDVRVLNRMTKDEAVKAGIDAGQERRYFCAETDGNLAPSSTKQWFMIESVGLANGEADGLGEDKVGVATAWTWPNPFDGVTVTDLRKAQAAIATGGPWRESPQAKDWAGNGIAKAMGLDPAVKADRAKVAGLLKTWIAQGMFVVVDGEDAKRMPRKFIEVGELADSNLLQSQTKKG